MSKNLTPFELAALKEPGYEVWSREGGPDCNKLILPHLLIVLRDNRDPPFRILDPQKEHKEIIAIDNYLEVVAYLRENDYHRLERHIKVESEQYGHGDDDDD
jgi:hypothetical protein